MMNIISFRIFNGALIRFKNALKIEKSHIFQAIKNWYF